ncbi:MAG: hypothetical protein KDL87_02675 [Verrucomicrobiae bacterium]|nr:hypothetical protein [Verrucomicrobiae bacterium]
MTLSLLALYGISNRKRWCFVTLMTANFICLGVAAFIHSRAIAIGNVILFANNPCEYRRWNAGGRCASRD